MVLEEYKDYFTNMYETDGLTVAVCNAEANRAQLSDMPHEQWEDLVAPGTVLWRQGAAHSK